eukprot:16201103-Heterocapsa_arctica.AAC.1
MQTIGGDEFILDKECIILLYCNKNTWGDAENHYDLMHPIPQQICKGKTYDRRSDNEQTISEQHKKSQVNGKQHQTNIGDDNSERNEFENEEFNGPKEDKNTQGLYRRA